MNVVAKDSPHSLHGRVALITGGSSDIGRAIAITLANHGAIVGIHYFQNERSARITLEAVQAAGSHGFLLPGDLRKEDDCNAIVDRLVAATDRLDILVNNAGSPIARSSIENCSSQLWHDALATNLTSAFLVSRRAIPQLKKCGNGAIVNNLSLSVQTGGANGAGPYAAAKGGLQVMTRTLAKELAPAVRVNAIMPGVIETQHHATFSTPERMAQYRSETPLGRNGHPDEVASVVLFLVSDASRFMTGAILDINGGRFMR